MSEEPYGSKEKQKCRRRNPRWRKSKQGARREVMRRRRGTGWTGEISPQGRNEEDEYSHTYSQSASSVNQTVGFGLLLHVCCWNLSVRKKNKHLRAPQQSPLLLLFQFDLLWSRRRLYTYNHHRTESAHPQCNFVNKYECI